mmetsp:Transcript_21722/g.20823  ORF Transcript_21722/g.20823 Transcript_21722/m.20823 type:complete len:205 (-) Transcript_21722:182-796(-)
MRVLLRWERSLIFRNVDLILSHQVVDPRVHLILEPTVRDSQVIVWVDSDGQFSWNGIPRVLMHLPNWCIAIDHHGHFIEGGSWPKDLNLLSLGVGNDLSGHISLVGLIEDIQAQVHSQVSIVDFFIGAESKLLDSEGFPSSESRHSSHEFFNVCRLGSVIPLDLHISIELLDVFHGPRPIIRRDWPRLSHRVHMPHVVDRRRRV